MGKHKLETKYSQSAGSQGSGRASPQFGRDFPAPAGRATPTVHPDRFAGKKMIPGSAIGSYPAVGKKK